MCLIQLMAGKHMMARRDMAISDDKPVSLSSRVTGVAVTFLFVATFVIRMSFDFYGLPGFSYKGLEHLSDEDGFLIGLAVFAFLAGTWGMKKPWHGLLMQVISLFCMNVYDLGAMFDNAPLPATSWLEELLEHLREQVFPAFWCTKKIECALLVLCLVQFALRAWASHRGRRGRSSRSEMGCS